MITVERYSSERTTEWNDFVRESRNATFLFNRGFMDYHSDRYTDHSLMFRKNGRLIGVLPANLTSEEGVRVLHSHSGLTYGGIILSPRHCGADDIIGIFNLLKEYCKDRGISELDYKPIPYIYTAMPSQEDIYSLWRLGAEMRECNLSVAIDLEHNVGFDSRQRRNCKRAERAGGEVMKIGADDEIDAFHQMLSSCLEDRHDVAPVHTADELKLLHSRFPSEIEFYVMMSGSEMHAGVCIFRCGMAVHAQYICTTGYGREHGMMALLMDSVIRASSASGARYFDFGTCNEDAGRYLNVGLAAQKYGLGGTGVCYPRLSLKI
ncbi:MAG: GNAT family N-acetyltransferase [Muribaculaceae bacterium]|nr:GNAT family N-acetyltransferase [Muribaculaceae bacterium]